ncbi:MAG: NAD(P)H-dependent oxidoreductase [Rhizomicrobium sp.]
MKIALIAAHPDPESFTLSVARTVREAASARGHSVELRDLYAMDFEPRLKASEIVGRPGFGPAPDVSAERTRLADAGAFIFVYPFWINAAPAILKGYIDRVFGFGFAFGPGPGANTPLLTGKKLLSFTSSGAPADWAERTGALNAERTIFEHHIAALAGLTVLDHIHFGGIVPGIRSDVVMRHLQTARATIAAHF